MPAPDTSTASKRYKSCSGYKLIDFIDFPQSCDNDISLLNLVEQTAFPICQCKHENQFTALFQRLSSPPTDDGRWRKPIASKGLAAAANAALGVMDVAFLAALS